MKIYINLQGEKISITICSYIIQRWLGWPGYKYKNLGKDIFINRYKWSDVVEDCKIFLEKIKELKPNIVKFEENNVMKKRFTYLTAQFIVLIIIQSLL